MKENWGIRGMPPRNMEVLHKFPISQNGGFERWQYWIQGHHPHLGTPIQGWSGPETVVIRERFGDDWRIRK